MWSRIFALAVGVACTSCSSPNDAALRDAASDDASSEGDASSGDAPWALDPGQPFPLYGGKCEVRDNDQAWLANACISVVTTFTASQVHLFLNHCMGTDGITELCQGVRDRYTSLVIADAADDTGHYLQAIGGRVLVNHPGEGRYEQVASPGHPIPIDYRVFRRPHESYPEGVLTRSLKVSLPRVDAPGEPLRMEATF